MIPKSKITPWLRFFRLPNLPTVPGDVLAGGTLALAVASGGNYGYCDCGTDNWFYMVKFAIPGLFTTAIIVLFAYMFGLADNDIVGAGADSTNAPKRPIPAGEITLTQARIARTLCLFAPFLCLHAFKLADLHNVYIAGSLFTLHPSYLYPAVSALLVFIVLYNRLKNKFRISGFFLMGLCRGVSLLCGVLAILGSVGFRPEFVEHKSFRIDFGFVFAVVCAFLGWTLYTAAITWLASDEHKTEEGLDIFRFIPGMAVFIPLIALRMYPENTYLPIILCCAFAYLTWARAVAPLGGPHTPAIRRGAVNIAVASLMWLQMGFVLSLSDIRLTTAFVPLLFARAAIRYYQPKISGS